MKLPLTFVGLAGALLLVTGCETMGFTKYSGAQRSWPGGTAFNTGDYAIPVYAGWPEKPYEVLGFVQFDQAGVDWNRGDIKQAAVKARDAGGDALILMPKGSDPSPTVSETRQQLGITGSETVGMVVKWK